MSWEPLCRRFSEAEFCTVGDEEALCGSWFFVEQESAESEISFAVEKRGERAHRAAVSQLSP